MIRIPNSGSLTKDPNKANVQIQTTGGNTININDVESGQTTEYQFVAEGNITATAVIQNETISPQYNILRSQRFSLYNCNKNG